MPARAFGGPVLDAVHQELLAHHLRRTSRAEGRYARRAPYGADLYYLVVNEYPDHLAVAPDVAVQHEVVERIFHRFSGSSPRYHRTTPTIGGQLAEIARDPRYRVEIYPDADPGALRGAEENLRASVAEAERYWARYADLREVDRALNDDPEERTPHRPMPWLRCATGVIVARLARRPDYDELELVYQEQMQVWSDGFYLPRFQALVRYLAERTAEQLLAENEGPGPGRGRQ
jgi:hypothetical protein